MGTIVRGLSALLLLAALAVLLRESWEIPGQTDDAYISYRYARNLVEGHGLVYNPGEYVEGMTNLLWTLLVAAGLSLGLEARFVGHALGVASAAAVLVLTAAYARTGSEARDWWVGLAPWLVLSFLPFAYWTTSGMETPLFTALVTAALLAQARERPGWATVLAFLATATRPDGALVASAIFGFHLLWHWRRQGWRVLAWPGAYAALLLGLTTFRLVYYGSPVPNTFYAKVGGVPPLRGVYYSLAFLVAGAWLLCVPAALAVARERRWWPAAAYLLLVTAYVVAVGGDAFPYSRFFVCVLPLLSTVAVRGAALAWRERRLAGGLAWAAIAAVLGLNFFGRYPWGVAPSVLLLVLSWAAVESILQRRPARVPLAAVAVAALLLLGAGSPDLAKKLGGLPGARARAAALERTHVFNERLEALAARRAQALAGRGGDTPLVATGGIGAFGYYARVPILDLFGLVDAEIARSSSEGHSLAAPGHLRANTEYVFSRKPDYLLVPRKGTPMITAPSIAEIWAHPDLDSHYVWDPELTGYRRKDRS